jgi:hypothetical protein
MNYYSLKYIPDVNDGIGGYAKYFLIRIKKKYEGTDKGILEHEKVHVRHGKARWNG